MNKYFERGYNDWKAGNSGCPYANDLQQYYWLQGYRKADLEEIEPIKPILTDNNDNLTPEPPEQPNWNMFGYNSFYSEP